MNKQTFIKNYIAKKRASLPYGVIPLKYLESNGQQWIDTGIELVAGINRCWIKFKWNGEYPNNYGSVVFGAYGINPTRGKPCYSIGFTTQLSNNPNKIKIEFDELYAYFSDSDNNDHVAQINCNDIGFVFESNVVMSETVKNATDASLSIQLFTRAAGSPTFNPERFYGRIYKFFYESANGNSVDMCPALYPAGLAYIDGNTLKSVTPSLPKPGMYDRVSGHFFVNKGTGDDFMYDIA